MAILISANYELYNKDMEMNAASAVSRYLDDWTTCEYDSSELLLMSSDSSGSRHPLINNLHDSSEQ